MSARNMRGLGSVALVVGTTVATLVSGLLAAPASSGTSLITAIPAAAPAGYTSTPLQETGRVVSDVDGDTFRFLEDGASQWVKVRLLGVNTPEVTGFNNIHFDQNMCGGEEAWHLLQSIMPAGTIHRSSSTP